MFAEELFSYLNNATSAGTRIYPNRLPQTPTFPAVRYLQITDPPEHTHSGRSSLRHPRYQFDCFDLDTETHDGYLGAVSLARELLALLDGYKGPLGALTCEAGFSENARDNYDPETRRHWVSVDVEIWHKEA
jgi:hypothetical protein